MVFLSCLSLIPFLLTKASLAQQTTYTATSGSFTTTATHSASGFDVESADGVNERFTDIGSAGISISTQSISRPGTGTAADLQSSGLSLSAGPAGSAFFSTFTVDSVTGNLVSSGSGTFEDGIVINNSGVTVNLGGNRVQGVATPTAGTDAANKAYVDGQMSGQQTQIDNVVTVNREQQTQIDGQGTRIGSLEVENAQQSAAISDLFARDEAQQRQIGNLQDRDEELAEGIAIALALDTPTFQPGQNFAFRAGWGNFDGADAFGVTAGGVLDRGSFGHNSSVILDGGVGFGVNTNTVAGKAGLSFGW